jgi:DnaJ-class molecular chaperone
MRPQLEGKHTSEEINVDVPVSLQELFHGTWKKSFEFPRLVICRGCRANPNSEKCQECGRCPPEKKQIPQFANTMFGRQVVGHKDKEVESNERCRTEAVKITGLKVGRGAQPGTAMKSMSKVGHQAPGRLPGTVHFKLAYEEDPTYKYAGEHLYSVLSITLSEAIHGFSKQWNRADGSTKVTLKRPMGAHNGQVLRIAGKGMFNPGASSPYGDIYVRIHVKMPSAADAAQAVSKGSEDLTADIRADNDVEVQEDGSLWRRYTEASEDAVLSTDKAARRDEL